MSRPMTSLVLSSIAWHRASPIGTIFGMERVNDSKYGESLKSHHRMLILILDEYNLRFAIISIIVSVLAIVI